MTPTAEVFVRQQAQASLSEADYMDNDVRSPPSSFSVASAPHVKSAPMTPPKSPAMTPGWD
eukprot:2158309-Karenia_brevis.AAC.1